MLLNRLIDIEITLAMERSKNKAALYA